MGTELKTRRIILDALETTAVIGEWYWVKDTDEKWLGCVTHIGSNYVQLDGVYGEGSRIHVDEFFSQCQKCTDIDTVISQKIEQQKSALKKLMDEVNQTVSSLGVSDTAPSAETQALATLVPKKTSEYKKDLVKAKDETLPKLFREIEETHREIATWMKARIIPLRAEAGKTKDVVENIDTRILSLEIYAGLVENVVRVKRGKAAPKTEKLHLLQRMHYMDEECLLDYQVGGMEFKDLRKFDQWLSKPKNLERLLPFPRCMLAFRIRRNRKERSFSGLDDFINFMLSGSDYDKLTFLYIRNGKNVYRLQTDIHFGETLFPNMHKSVFGAEELMALPDGGQIVSRREYEAMLAEHRKKVKKEKAQYKKEMREWEALSKKEKEKKGKPYYWAPHSDLDRFVTFNPSTVYYDDIAQKIAKDMAIYNRIALLIQGIFDRSEILHPHDKVRIWTEEGFDSAIELVYDKDRALNPEQKPDFLAFQNRLNKTITKGSITVGQHKRWMQAEADKRKMAYQRYYQPWDNPGPGLFAKVQRLSRDKKTVHYTWERERKMYSRPYKGGFVRCHFSTEVQYVLNVDAYTPGDYLQFFQDPRTREEYLQWAPLLLAAEDYHAKKGQD